MKIYNRKQLNKIYPNHQVLFNKDNKFFVVDYGINPFKNIQELRCFLLNVQMNKCILKGDR